MIKVLLNDYLLDLTNVGINTIDKNNMFRDEQTKSYSYPFPLILTDDIGRALGIPDIQNISNYLTTHHVKVLENSTFHDGTLNISKIVGKKANVTLFYGIEILAVYDMNLKTLPFEIINVSNVSSFAKSQNSKQWPEATHNFATVKDEEFEKKSDYKHFEGYLNKTLNGNFVNNSFVLENEERVAANKNVLVPMPYLLEILRVGYAQENKVIKGSFIDDIFNHKIIFLPENYLEQFSTSVLDVSNFENPYLNYIVDDLIYSSYQKTYLADLSGSYKLDFKLDFTKEAAASFDLKIKQGNTVLFSVQSTNTEIHISETITVSSNTNNNTQITFNLILLKQENSISEFNSLKYEYQETKLNIFSNTYSLADFMPDMNFRDYVNIIQNLFNLDLDVQENVVYLNYIDDVLPSIIYDKHEKHETPNPPTEVNSNKVFRLKYDDGTAIYVNKNGIIPSTNAENDPNLIKIDIPVIPLQTGSFDGEIITAKNTKETTSLKICLFGGLVGLEPLTIDSFRGRSLSIADIYKKFESWLRFRTNSEKVTHSFFAHVTENFNIKKGASKYNKKHIIREIQKKSVNKNWNKVTVKSETF
jgi:hypothetical protein